MVSRARGGAEYSVGGSRLVAADTVASGVVSKPGGGLVGGAGICTACCAFPPFLGRLSPLLGGDIREVEGFTHGRAGLYVDGVPMVRVHVRAGRGVGEQRLEDGGGEGHKVDPFFEGCGGNRYGGTQVVREGCG